MKLCENKVALITSRNTCIGLACAKKLAENGAKVYLAVRRLDGTESCRWDHCRRRTGGVVYFDADKEETFTSMVDEVVAKKRRIDILVNNYGATMMLRLTLTW